MPSACSVFMNPWLIFGCYPHVGRDANRASTRWPFFPAHVAFMVRYRQTCNKRQCSPAEMIVDAKEAEAAKALVFQINKIINALCRNQIPTVTTGKRGGSYRTAAMHVSRLVKNWGPKGGRLGEPAAGQAAKLLYFFVPVFSCPRVSSDYR